MQDVHVKLSHGLPWQKQHTRGRKFFQQQIGLTFKEETSEVLHLEHSIVWSWKLHTLESGSEIPGKF
jgi:hypothetical protein